MIGNEAVDRFIRSLVKNKLAPAKAPEPEEDVRPVRKPPAASKPVVLPVVDKDAEFRKRYDDELDAIVEFEQYPQWFDESDVGIANAKRVIAWILKQGLHVSKQTVREGVDALRDTLTPLRHPEPAPKAPPPIRVPIADTKPAIQPAPVAPPAKPEPVDDLPPVPDYVWRRIGKNPFITPKNVRDIPSAVFSELYHSAVGPAFKARVDAILRKAQGLR